MRDAHFANVQPLAMDIALYKGARRAVAVRFAAMSATIARPFANQPARSTDDRLEEYIAEARLEGHVRAMKQTVGIPNTPQAPAVHHFFKRIAEHHHVHHANST